MHRPSDEALSSSISLFHVLDLSPLIRVSPCHGMVGPSCAKLQQPIHTVSHTGVVLHPALHNFTGEGNCAEPHGHISLAVTKATPSHLQNIPLWQNVRHIKPPILYSTLTPDLNPLRQKEAI